MTDRWQERFKVQICRRLALPRAVSPWMQNCGFAYSIAVIKEGKNKST